MTKLRFNKSFSKQGGINKKQKYISFLNLPPHIIFL